MTARLRLLWRGGAAPPASLQGLAQAFRDGAAPVASALERLPVLCGKRSVALGELFRVVGSCDGDAPQVEIEPHHARLDDIGFGWSRGSLVVDGHAGHYCGAGLEGGEMRVTGCVADYAAAGMRGGRLQIKGSAGAFLGGALVGERLGMVGGVVTVAGDAGDYAGASQGRGLLVVAGGCGCFLRCRYGGRHHCGAGHAWEACGAAHAQGKHSSCETAFGFQRLRTAEFRRLRRSQPSCLSHAYGLD